MGGSVGTLCCPAAIAATAGCTAGPGIATVRAGAATAAATARTELVAAVLALPAFKRVTSARARGGLKHASPAPAGAARAGSARASACRHLRAGHCRNLMRV